MLVKTIILVAFLAHVITSLPVSDFDQDCDELEFRQMPETNRTLSRSLDGMKWVADADPAHYFKKSPEGVWEEWGRDGVFGTFVEISSGEDETGPTLLLKKSDGLGVLLNNQGLLWGPNENDIKFIQETGKWVTIDEEGTNSRGGRDDFVEVKVWPPLDRIFPDDTPSDSDLTPRDEDDDEDCETDDEDIEEMHVNHDGSVDCPPESHNRNGQGLTAEDVCPITCANQNMTWTGAWGSVMIDDVTTCKCKNPMSPPVVSRQSRIDMKSCERFLCDAMLAASNRYRSKHRVGSLSMDRSLSSSATSWAVNLARTNRFEHSRGSYGENLAAMAYGQAPQLTKKLCSDLGASFTKMWYDEVKDWDFGRGASRGGVTGHFTQLVWKSSRTFGCGLGIGQNGRRFVNVGQYKPPGNYQGQYKQNVFRG